MGWNAIDISKFSVAMLTPENVKILGIMFSNIATVVGVVTVNKIIYRTGFKFPSLLMAFHFFVTWLFVLGNKAAGNFETKRTNFRVYISLGLAMALAVGFNNMSLLHNTIGTYQIFKFLSILLTCIIEFVWKNKTYPTMVYASLVMLVVGVSIATVMSVELTAFGVFYGLFGALFVSWYQVYNKATQTDHAVSAMQLLEFEQPCSAFWCFFMAFFTDDLANLAAVDWTGTLVMQLLVSGFFAFGVNLSSFLIIGKTSPITYSVVGHAKTLLLFIVGFTFLGEKLATSQAFGLVMAVCALFWYTALTTTPPKPAGGGGAPSSIVVRHPGHATEAERRDLLSEKPPANLRELPESTHMCVVKMRRHGASEMQIRAFASAHMRVLDGERGLIREASIEPPQHMQRLEQLSAKYNPDPSLLHHTVVLKLNGGLGTSMGMERAKSLMVVHQDKTFLDIMAEQILHFRRAHKCDLRFMMLNSFNTSEDTMHYLQVRYPALFPSDVDSTRYFREHMEVMQSTAPKILVSNHEPAFCPENERHEWYPPGHGELWNALAGTGQLDRLLHDGVYYMFVSNGDNLGATMDLSILTMLAKEKLDFVLECADRTQMDVKGSHVAQYKESGRLLVRDIAQTAQEEHVHFFDIKQHSVFNTNSLWVDLRSVKRVMQANNGIMPLPVVRNGKHLNPTDPETPKVLQLESSVASAIEVFERTAAIVVPRTRFSPVKMCSDLLALRSDAYYITPDKSLSLNPQRNGRPPQVSLDDAHYREVDKMEQMLGGSANIVPSLVRCNRLSVDGRVCFGPGVVIVGDCEIVNKAAARKTVPPGTHTGRLVLGERADPFV